MARTNVENQNAWRARQLADPARAKVYREKRAKIARAKKDRVKAEIEGLRAQLMAAHKELMNGAEHVEMRDGPIEELQTRLMERYAAAKDTERRENPEERERERILYDAVATIVMEEDAPEEPFFVRVKSGWNEYGLRVDDLADDTMGRAFVAYLQTMAQAGTHPLDTLSQGTRDMLIRWLSKGSGD